MAGINTLGLRPYRPDVDSEGLHHDDSPCGLAVEDRGMAAIVQSASRENAYETAWAVLDLTHPPLPLIAGYSIPTVCN